MKLFRWVFWSFIYGFRREPHDLKSWLTRSTRTWPPWWKFKPIAYRNDDGKMWQIWLKDEVAFTRSRQMLNVELQIGQESGEIVGLNIWDENLKVDHGP